MRLGKKLVALGMVACLSAASSLTAFAEEISISIDCTYTPEIGDPGTELNISYYGVEETGKLYNLYDENTMITMNMANSYGFRGTPTVEWGYMENGKYVYVAPFEKEDDTIMGVQDGKSYPVINPEQLAKDKADGSAYSKTYVLMFDAVSSVNSGDVYMYAFFKLNSDQSTANAPTEKTASWASNDKGWWIQYSDGTYLTNGWYQSPESGLYYYMGADGYMLTNTTTPDGYYVNADGVWVQ